jgi:hypothetical protein
MEVSSMDMDKVYYIYNGKKFSGLGDIISYYNVHVSDGEGVPCVAGIIYCGVEIGQVNIDRLDAEISRNET